MEFSTDPGSETTASNRGIVYVLTNDAMPDYIKIGRTAGHSSNAVLGRMQELARPTGVPLPFNCEYAAVVDDYLQVEQTLLNDVFGDRRVGNKEFLESVSPFRVKAVLKLLEIEDVTPVADDVEKPSGSGATPRKSKAERFRFSLAEVPIGSILEWADDRQITCRVVDDRHVEYDGERTTISGAAKHLKEWTAAQGSLYWIYEDETLQERRDRIESENDE